MDIRTINRTIKLDCQLLAPNIRSGVVRSAQERSEAEAPGYNFPLDIVIFSVRFRTSSFTAGY
jgi:hypothetical protein